MANSQVANSREVAELLGLPWVPLSLKSRIFASEIWTTLMQR